MTSILLRNARVFDGIDEDCSGGISVLVEDGVIRELSDKAIKADG